MEKRKGISYPSSKKYRQIKALSESRFRRLVGVKKATFALMVKILKKARRREKIGAGPPHTLSLADRLLMCLEYLREYRTYFHVGLSYGLSESAAYRNCRGVEDTLIKSSQFSLPGRKALAKSDHEFEVILIDASESPIERPKKKSETSKGSNTETTGKSAMIQGKRSDTP